MAKRSKRKKNLSTGAWVAIGIGLGVVLPVAIVGGIMIYAIKKGSQMVEEGEARFDAERARLDDESRARQEQWEEQLPDWAT